MTTVVNLRRDRYDVYIGRGSPFGNPYVLGRDGTRAEVIAKYRAWVLTRPELIARIQRELKDKVLGCYCTPALCHGNTIADIANGVWP